MPKICEVYENQNEIIYLLEDLKGGELFSKIKSQLFYTEKTICFIMNQLISTLKYLHNLGIMHRDIKPENIILKYFDTLDICLIDYGFADYISNKNKIYEFCGTPGYIAPEILNRKSNYNEKVDIFSAGVILYIMYA